MRKFLFILFLSFSVSSFAQLSDMLTDQFLEHLVAGNYQEACRLFSDELKSAIPPESLREEITKRETLDGDMLIRPKILKTFYQSHDLIYRFAWFGEQGYRFYFELENDRITAFSIQKEAVTNNYTLPLYAAPDKVKTRQILILSEGYGITGEFMQPAGVDNFPVFIFIHGSGPNDRDEGIFGNRPFRDIAFGLAANGIASLRFDKNSYLFGAFLAEEKEYTIWDETGADIIKIIDYLNTQENIPDNRIFLLGHSQGAMMIPRILDSADVAGAIMIAGNARPLQDVIYEQMLFFAKQDGYSDSDKRRMTVLQEQVDNLELLRNQDAETFKKPLPFGLTAWYWKDLLNYDQVGTLKEIDEPILLLQGEGDYQVSMTDYKMFRKALRKRKLPFVAISYPGVNHLLFENEGKPSVKEYERNKNVEAYIINDIIEWTESVVNAGN